MATKEVLNEKIQILFNSIEKKFWKYYFLESLDNFIYYLDEIKSSNVHERASTMINSCLSEIDYKFNNGEYITDVYKDLYSRHIYYLGEIYKTHLGFINKPYYPIYILILIFICVVIAAISNIFISLFTVALIILIFLVSTIPKIRQRKYY